MLKKIIFLIAVTGILVSGCVSNQKDKPAVETSTTSTISPLPTASPAYNQVSQSADQSKMKELEDKINSLQKQVDELQTRINRVDLLKPSSRTLIPTVPFRIEVRFGEMQSPTSWAFKEKGILEITEAGIKESGTYRLFPNNNTIIMDSEKYDFYGIVLYDDYVAAIYDNGWIAWVHKYQIMQKYNPETQKYEI